MNKEYDMTITFSEDNAWYYIDNLSCSHCNWVSVQTFIDMPKFIR